jgi:uracil-DNA glycosylase family 4
MRAALTAITEELKRLKAAGVRTVAVSDAGLAGLRALAAKRRARVVTEQPAEPAVAAPVESFRPKPVAVAPLKVALAAPALALPPAPKFTLPAGDKATRWAALRETVLNDPTCLARVRPGKQVVFGVGDVEAKIMFVGEAPGAEEEVQGEPFVGPAGQLLTRMIGAMGLKRSDVYIGNIMNWRPELPLTGSGVQYGNRPPTEAEMNYCLPYLQAQIEIVNPQVLVALGTTAAQGLLGAGTFGTLGEVRGKWKDFAGKPLMVTYHPSYILRNQSNRSKRMIWEDLLKVMERAGLPISDKQRGYFSEAAQ